MKIEIDTNSLTDVDREHVRKILGLPSEADYKYALELTEKMAKKDVKRMQKEIDTPDTWRFEKLRPLTVGNIVYMIVARYDGLPIADIMKHLTASVERNTVYTALSNLKAQGLVDSSESRPKVYWAKENGDPVIREMLPPGTKGSNW